MNKNAMNAALEKTANGEPSAFQPIAQELALPLFRYVKSIVRDDEVASDLVQDAFVRAIEKARTFRGDASVKTWVFAIARNLAYGHLRRKKLHERSMTVLELGVDAGWGQLTDPERIATLKEENQILHDAIGELKPEAREVILLRDIEGNSGEETAEILGMSVSAMKTLLHRSRLKLMAKIKRRLDQ